MRKIQNWLWIWVFWAFLLGGCSKAVGTFDPDSAPSGSAPGQVAAAPSASSEVSITELAVDPLPMDLGTELSFSTKGYVFARESYTNNSSHPVHLWPSSHPNSLILKSQFTDQVDGGPPNNYTTTLGLSLAVTSDQKPRVMERLSDSIMGSSITLAAGEKVTLNWRVGPASGSLLCVFSPGTFTYFGITTTLLISGSELDLDFQRSVQVGDDQAHLQDVLPSESPVIHSSSGILNTDTASPTICEGIYIDFMGSNPGDYEMSGSIL